MQSSRRILFMFPYDWLTNPRSVKEILFLKGSKYKPIIIWTNARFALQHGKSVSSSPRFDVSSKGVDCYQVPFFVSPLNLAKHGVISRICFLTFYLVSTITYSLWLFSLMFLVCVEKQVQLIHVHNTPDLEGFIASLVSKITGTPYVFEVHDHTPELFAETMNLQSDSMIFKLLKIIERTVVSSSSGNIFVSKTSERFFQMAYDLDPSKSIVVYSGPYRNFIDSNKYDDIELDDVSRENLMVNKFKILYLGSMEDGFRRGLDILVESMGHLIYTYRLSNIVLVFVGDGGGMMEKLKELALDYKVSDYVSFQGMVPRREAYKWLRIADVVVDPLRGAASTEACVTNKDLEYMAAQKTIIASDLIGHREILRNGYNGFLFRDGDALDLADKIRFIIENAGSSAVQKLGINAGKDFSEKYCWEMQQHKLLDLYKEILE